LLASARLDQIRSIMKQIRLQTHACRLAEAFEERVLDDSGVTRTLDLLLSPTVMSDNLRTIKLHSIFMNTTLAIETLEDDLFPWV
jgi:hypothetical protein